MGGGGGCLDGWPSCVLVGGRDVLVGGGVSRWTPPGNDIL